MTMADLLAASGLPGIDAEVLLAHAAGKDRSWVIAHTMDEADAEIAGRFMGYAKRRMDGEPAAYIVGHREFYGRNFVVRPGVLIPRPCTEELVTIALRMLKGESVPAVTEIDSGIVAVVATFGPIVDVRTVVDVGTGSGCIGVTLALEDPSLRCIATDASSIALDIARENAANMNVMNRMTLLEGNLLEPATDLTEPFLLVTNPPYVADETLLGQDTAAFEPRLALMGGGADGGDLLRAIVKQASAHPYCRGIVAECLSAQARIVTNPALRPT